MAFGTKYRTEFTDFLGVDWKVDIQIDPDPGAITTLKATGSPLHIEWNSDSDDFNEPIRSSKATINVYSTTDFALNEFYSDEDFKYKVLIYYGTTLYWSGYIVSGEYSEPYDQTPYVVSIRATDGLAYLKNMLYKYETAAPDDTYYNGRRMESQVLLDVLGKIGITTFTEYVNIYEESMDDAAGDSPMDQLRIDVDVFRDMYCWEVLGEVLKKYNAIIIQRLGVMRIIRPVEVAGVTMYGRTFTAAATKSATTFTPVQYIDRTVNTSDMIQGPGSVMMIKRPAKKITCLQDYGSKESWIDNYEFTADSFDGVDFESWTASGGAYNKAIGDYVAGEKNGIAIIDQDVLPASYIYQDIGLRTKLSATDLLTIEFEYAFYNNTAGVINNATVGIDIYQTKHLHDDDGTYCEWSAVLGESLAFLETVNIGWTGWKSYKRQVLGIEESTDMRVMLYGDLNNTGGDLYVCFRNIKFYASSYEIDSLTIKRKLRQRIIWHGNTGGENSISLRPKYYTVKYVGDAYNIVENTIEATNAINGVEREYNYILGDVTKDSGGDGDTEIDNILEQFGGSLSYTLETLTKVAAKFVTDWAATYLAGGVVVTSSGAAVIFTSSVAGTNFTGNTTITGTSGDLDGGVVATQANVVAVSEIDRIDLSGSAGTANISCNGVTQLATFNFDLATTASDFVTAWAVAFAAVGVTITDGVDCIYFESVAGTALTAGAAIVNVTGDLDGLKVDAQAAVAAVARIDTVTLTGTYGTADILCDGTTKEVSFNESYTTDWNTRGGAESDPLIEVIAAETADQYSRPKQLIQMNIQEKSVTAPVLNIIGRVEDELNTIGGNNRTFMFNAGGLDIKMRRWNADLLEIIFTYK